MRTLARIADGSILDVKQKPKTDAIDVVQLTRDLGDRLYRVRASAATRLRLLGEPALPYLDKGIADGPSAAGVARGKELKEQILQSAAQGRKEFLTKVLPGWVRPQLAFVAKAEQRLGQAVHVVTVKLAGAEPALENHAHSLLGPEWNHIRLAVHG